MEITKTVALNLRSLRDGQKLTRDALAKLARVSSQTIYDIENENKKPSLLVIESLAIALKVKPSALLEEGTVLQATYLPVSETIQKLLAIPDRVYELAQDVPLDDEAWDLVEGALDGAKERRKLLKLPGSNKG
jgi:transcriptional regulator with XRE-family HTH domain